MFLEYSRLEKSQLHLVFRVSMLLVFSVALSASCRQQPQAQRRSEPSQQAVAATKPSEMPSVVIGKPYPGTGVITIINEKEGWVEINHEPIEGLMPAMQMEWWVKDKSLLRNVKVGDKVDFVVVETGKGEYITEMKKTSAPQ